MTLSVFLCFRSFFSRAECSRSWKHVTKSVLLLVTGSEGVGGYRDVDQALVKDDGLGLTLISCDAGFSSELAVTMPGFSTRIIFATISIRMTKMVQNVWTKMRNLRESRVGLPSYSFGNSLASDVSPVTD